jgi:thymidylate synthase
MLLAVLLEIPTNRVILVTGDTHIYEQHIENAKIQMMREPYKPPSLKITKPTPSKNSDINEKIKWLEELTFEDFELTNYECHPPLKYEMIA